MMIAPWALSIVGIFGNFFIILLFFIDPIIKKNSQIFSICLLAGSDLLMCISVLYSKLLIAITDQFELELSRMMCVLTAAFGNVAVSSSLRFVLFIALERFAAAKLPLHYRKWDHKKHAQMFGLFNTAAAIIQILLILAGVPQLTDPITGQCRPALMLPAMYKLISSIADWLIIAGISIGQGVMIYQLRKNRIQIAKESSMTKKQQEKERKTEQKRVHVVMGVMMACVILVGVPRGALTLVSNQIIEVSQSTTQLVGQTAGICVVLNSIINVFIYLLVRGDFKEAAQRTMQRTGLSVFQVHPAASSVPMAVQH